MQKVYAGYMTWDQERRLNYTDQTYNIESLKTATKLSLGYLKSLRREMKIKVNQLVNDLLHCSRCEKRIVIAKLKRTGF